MRLIDKVIVVLFYKTFSTVTKHSFICIAIKIFKNNLQTCMSSCVISLVESTLFGEILADKLPNLVSQSPAKQISVVGGFGPGQDRSGRVATVFENSRKILHSTFRRRIPSPQGTLQASQSSTMKL